ncbi:MAG TPA: hypothetical protein VFH54_20400 [Mycobacteriales bacterium]|nr:hypothetical protein [Mycobacteriales bacterium]
MGQIAHLARSPISGSLVSAVALVAIAPLLSGCGGSLASATTTIAGAVDAQVVHVDGSQVAGVDGLRLRRGDLVRTGPLGRVELHTRGRVVYAGSEASLQVVNGAAQVLRHGAVVVDAQHGPGLTLQVAAFTLNAAAGTASRAERGATIRLGALAGRPSVDNDTGRQLQMSRLSQVVLGGDALPDSTSGSPLRLTDDDGEAHAVPALVRDDLALDALAHGIDSTGAQTLHVVTAAWHQGLDPLPAGVQRSEQVLPVVIAAAVKGGDAIGRYRSAVALRQAGGSWGVIADLLGTSSAAVLAALQAFENGAATGQVGTVPAALSFVSASLQPPDQPAPATGGGSDSQPPGSSPSSQPSPSPSSSPGLIPSTIDKVLSLVPTPLPTPTALSSSLLGGGGAVPLPVPSVSLPGDVLTPVPLPTLPH